MKRALAVARKDLLIEWRARLLLVRVGVTESGMFRVAGVNAFRCDASTRDKSQSILQVHVPYNNRVWVLSFYSTGGQVSRFTAVPKILQSLQFLP